MIKFWLLSLFLAEPEKDAGEELDDLMDASKKSWDAAFPEGGKFYNQYAKRVPNIGKRMKKFWTKFGCGEESDRKRRNVEEVLNRITRSTGEPGCDAILEVSENYSLKNFE